MMIESPQQPGATHLLERGGLALGRPGVLGREREADHHLLRLPKKREALRVGAEVEHGARERDGEARGVSPAQGRGHGVGDAEAAGDRSVHDEVQRTDHGPVIRRACVGCAGV